MLRSAWALLWRRPHAGGRTCECSSPCRTECTSRPKGAAAQAQRLEVIANNLANVDTAGFKQDVPTFQARFAEAIQQGQAQPGDRSINDIGGGVKIIDVETDHSTGQLKHTGNDLDLAINGKGFFHVRGDDGKQYLTRAGNFALDTQGRLVTQNGHRPVLDQARQRDRAVARTCRGRFRRTGSSRRTARSTRWACRSRSRSTSW